MKKLGILIVFLCSLALFGHAQQKREYQTTRMSQVLTDSAKRAIAFFGLPVASTLVIPPYVPDSVKKTAIGIQQNGNQYMLMHYDPSTTSFQPLGVAINPASKQPFYAWLQKLSADTLIGTTITVNGTPSASTDAINIAYFNSHTPTGALPTTLIANTNVSVGTNTLTLKASGTGSDVGEAQVSIRRSQIFMGMHSTTGPSDVASFSINGTTALTLDVGGIFSSTHYNDIAFSDAGVIAEMWDKKGIQYAGDYSSFFVGNSLITKTFADGRYAPLSGGGYAPAFTGSTSQYTRGDGSYATFPTALSAFTNDGVFMPTTFDGWRYQNIQSVNNHASIIVQNNSSGTNANASLRAINDLGNTVQMSINSSGFTPAGSNIHSQPGVAVVTTTGQKLYIGSRDSLVKGEVNIWGGTPVLANVTIRVDSLQQVWIHHTVTGTAGTDSLLSIVAGKLKRISGSFYLTPSSSSTLTNKSGNISQWTNDSGYATASSTNTFTNKSGNISQWTNDVGYITTAASGANPTASAGTSPVNGVAITFMRSDAAPKIDSAAYRTVANSITLAALQTKFNLYVLKTVTVAGFALSSNVTLGSHTAGNGLVGSAYTGAAAQAWTVDTAIVVSKTYAGRWITAASTNTITNKDLTSGTNTFPTFNQNTTGSAAKWTTARNLAGNSVDGSANVVFANKYIVQGTTDAGLSAAQFLGALGTGIVKNTTTTGILSIAVAGDFPTLNQNTTGTASNLSGTPALPNGVTATTQAAASADTKLATDAYADNAITAYKTAVAIETNKDLTSGTNTFPTFNQNTTGSAAKWTTARNLAGNSVDGSANVAFANKFIVQGTSDAGLSSAQFLGALGTGIMKNTTTTGVLSVAVAGDFPTLNQSTTGSAATLTTPRAINGVNFDGSAAITITANTANSLTNGFGVKTLSFNGGGAASVVIDSAFVSTIVGLKDTIAAHTAVFGAGILYTSGTNTLAVDTAGIIAGKTYVQNYTYTKNQILATSHAYTASSSITINNSAATTSAGFELINSNAATVGNQMYTPYLHFNSNGWGTTAGASQASEWRIYSAPAQGATPNPILNFDTQVNGGGWTNRLTLSGGTITGQAFLGNFGNITTGNTSDAYYANNSTAATSGVPNQYSPNIHMRAEVWNTTSVAANNWVDFKTQVLTTSGTTPLGKWTLSGSLTTTNTASFTDLLSVANNGDVTILVGHLIGGGSAPTIAAGTGAGTSPTVTVSGSDIAGIVNITTGTSPAGSNAIVATITFHQAYAAAPKGVVLSAANTNAAGLATTTQVFVPATGQTNGVTTTTFVVESNATNLTASTAYIWTYHIIQ